MSGPDLGGSGGAPDQTPPTPQTPPPARPGESAGAAASQASAAAGQAASAAAAAMEGMFRSFSVAEQFMVGGALLAVIGGQFLFGSLFGGGVFAGLTLLASSELLLAVWLKNRQNIQWPASYGLILSALVVAVVIPELDGFLGWLHGVVAGGGLGGGSTLLAELCDWAGAVLMGWGAILYWRTGGK
ncbi:MAG TPA: hypothetical protein VN771_04035 [Candidatus Baltobacteraceae bacterium]|nr:hypothetical protein [Candidatus Baltobacteraceae bacterium]